MIPEIEDWVRVRIEVRAGSHVKRGPNGRIALLSPFPSPFNYGSVVGDMRSPDGDPLDALVLGPRLRRGDEVQARVWGVVDFLDAGLDDPKVVVGDRLLIADVRRIERFFRRYALLKRLRRPTRPSAFRGWSRGPHI